MTDRVQRGSPDRDARLAELEAEGLFVIEWTDSPGTAYPPHSHPQREIRVVLDGSLTVHMDGEPVELGPGDRLELPAGEEHSMQVGPDGATYLSASDRHP